MLVIITLASLTYIRWRILLPCAAALWMQTHFAAHFVLSVSRNVKSRSDLNSYKIN